MSQHALFPPAVLLLAAAAVSGCAGTQAQPASAGSQPAAQVGGARITVEDVDKRAAGALARLDFERYEARRQVLDDMVNEKLLEEAARAKGVTPEALLKTEVNDKVAQPTDELVRATYEQHQAQLGGVPFEQLKERIRKSLYDQALQSQAAIFQLALKKDTRVQILLEEPRAAVAVPASAPAQGPADAKVTIVEFLDYQCPFCHRAQEAVDKVLKQYEGRVRFVHRDYMLGKPRSLPAARAARCAGEQGRFWEYHRGLLLEAGDLSDADLLRRAGALGLDGKTFTSCTVTDRYDADIQAATSAGGDLGVSGTPTFFINGRRLVGARSVEDFQAIIEAELQKPRG
ncbi:MAG TPA: thioredoxin domain-containing protein [Vicinamibacteria bacterium]|nr:thioredoxin domain-containing protein [Vicinamibacteria bacterium]